MNIYIYLFLIFTVMFVLYEAIILSIRYCPVKIREVLTISFILIAFRFISILLILILDNIKYLYLLKNLVFLDIIYIPMIIFISLYIFYRNVKINLKWFYGVFILGLLGYLVCVFKIPMEYYISSTYGYNIVLKSTIPYKILLCFNGASFYMGVKSYRYKHSIKCGAVLIALASLLFIGTTAVVMKNIENIGYLLIGDLGWIIALYTSIRTFKEKSMKYNI